MHYVEIAVNTNVHRTFYYHVPPELENKLVPGHLVRVGFGTAMQPGIVLGYAPKPDFETRPVMELLDPEPVMTEAHIDLALWMSQAYLTPPGFCLWLMLPPGLTGKNARQVTLVEPDAMPWDSTQALVVELLKKKGSLLQKALEQAVGVKSLRPALNELAERGIVRIESVLSTPAVRPKMVRTIRLAADPDTLPPVRSALHRHIVRFLSGRSYTVDAADLYEETGADAGTINTLVKKGILQTGERPVWRDSLADRDFVPSSPLRLTAEQRQVWEVIRQAIEQRAKKATENENPHPSSPAGGGGASPSPSTGQGVGGGVALPLKKTDFSSTWGEFHRWQTSPHLWNILKPLAREMRQQQTPAEMQLWGHLRRQQLEGCQFRRQHSIERFIVDFYCPEARLVIEVDGEIHQYTPEEDRIRQEFLEAQHLRVLRFTNEQVYHNIDGVVSEIGDALLNPLPASDTDDLDDFAAAQGAGAFLLHGVTGSGKTEIYLYAIERTLALGRQAIFLVPEIALTPQTIRRVAERFPDQVAVVHGSLSQGERYDTWRRAREGKIQVIVGTRSALFTPLPDVGLIILDEEHDHSYKHQPPFNPPYYHARAVAEELVRVNEGVLILGSATPELETFYRAQRQDLEYLHLPGRIMGHRTRIHDQSTRAGVVSRYRDAQDDAMTIDLPPVEIVDMRDELKANNRSIFSRTLLTALAQVIVRREQAILFLNRRGQATYVFCRDCGYVAACRRCDMPMTYHRSGEAMRCHHCGNTQPVPTTCPECGSSRIKFFGAGTQQVEDELIKLFPDIRCIRWDADTADKPDMHEAILGQFIAHEADIMVGTQMIAKGLDLPLVTLVGVINADPGLALPDFRATERTFQLLTQVAGRAGRGILGGQVIVQTYQPGHPAIQAAAQHDYSRFYGQEIEDRRKLGYPPFRRLARLLIQSTHPVNVQRDAEAAAAMLRRRIEALDLTDTLLIGPAPCFFSKIDKHYRWHVLLRSPNPLRALDDFPLRQGWSLDIDPVDVL